MRENRTSGSVEGAGGDFCPYSDWPRGAISLGGSRLTIPRMRSALPDVGFVSGLAREADGLDVRR